MLFVLYTQRAVLCSYLRLISRCVIFSPFGWFCLFILLMLLCFPLIFWIYFQLKWMKLLALNNFHINLQHEMAQTCIKCIKTSCYYIWTQNANFFSTSERTICSSLAILMFKIIHHIIFPTPWKGSYSRVRPTWPYRYRYTANRYPLLVSFIIVMI